MKNCFSLIGGAACLAAILILPAGAATLPPANTVFAIEITAVMAAPWAAVPGNLEERTLTVEFRAPKILKSEPPFDAPTGVLHSSIRQDRTRSGRIGDSLLFWSALEPETGDRFIVFANRKAAQSWGDLVAEPVSVHKLGPSDTAAEDVETIMALEKLDPAAQAGRVLELVRHSRQDRSAFLARHLAGLALDPRSSTNQILLDAVGDSEGLRLTDRGKSELLRVLHLGLAMQERPPAHASDAFARATLGTLGSAPASGDAPVPSRVRAACEIYLPWLQTQPGGLRSRNLPAGQRVRAVQQLRSLASRPQFGEPVRRGLLDAAAGLEQSGRTPRGDE